MKDVKKDILWRVYIIYVFVLIFALSILGKVVYIQFVEGDYWVAKAREQSIEYRNIEAIRGDICSDDGSLLATSVPFFEVRMDVNADAITNEIFEKNVDSLAYCLSNLFGDKTKSEYKKMLVKARKEGERYLLIKRNVTFSELKEVRKFPIFRAGRYKGGLMVIQKNRREMPYKWLAARTIGFEREGYYVGLEGAYTKEIGGVSGKRLMQKISHGIWMPISDENEIEPQDGSDLITTIDINLQDVAENALLKQLTEQKASHGCVVLMEVATGQIKAIANLTRKADGTYDEMFNYAIGESSEPGSTFKLISLVAALEDGVVDVNDLVSTGNGRYKYADREMVDAHTNGYGTISVKRAFELSSNVGISKVIDFGYQKNPQKFTDRLYAMNIGKPLGLDIAGEGMPIVKTPKSKTWSRVSLPWMAIGYEVALTPLQILTFYNAIANNGKMVKPMFVKQISKRGKIVKTFETEILNPAICSKSTIAKAKSMLEGVVEFGTATNLKNTPYKIAGKTGTAQVADKGKGYNKTNYKASFAGFFPAENPKYSCIVVINNPSAGAYYGSAVAAPVFKEIADRVYALRLDIHEKQNVLLAQNNSGCGLQKVGYTPDLINVFKQFNYKIDTAKNDCNDWTLALTKGLYVTFNNRNVDKKVMPNVIGMGAKDAVFLLESIGLSVKLNGRGVVESQSIEAGTTIKAGQLVSLEFSEGTTPKSFNTAENQIKNLNTKSNEKDVKLQSSKKS